VDYTEDMVFPLSEFSFIELSISEDMIPEKDLFSEMMKDKEKPTFSPDSSSPNSLFLLPKPSLSPSIPSEEDL